MTPKLDGLVNGMRTGVTRSDDRKVQRAKESRERNSSNATEGDYKRVLEVIRKRGEAWRNGVAGILAASFALLAFGDKVSIVNGYPAELRIAVSLLLGAAIITAVASLYFFLRAANGATRSETSLEPVTLDRLEARRRLGIFNLYAGQIAIGVSVVAFLGAVIASWMATP